MPEILLSPPANKPVTSPNAGWICAFLLLLLAFAVRVYPTAGFTGVGFDESLYRNYLLKLDSVGLWQYPAICQVYLEDQRKPVTIAKLPPTRFLYIFCGWLWKRLEFGNAPPSLPGTPGYTVKDPALVSLHRVSALSAILLVGLVGMAAARMLSMDISLAVLALAATAPVQIHLAQHALIDGFFAFWATLCLWSLWENLRHPSHRGWLTLHSLALACMVVAKENAFFVYVALLALLVANRWLRFGSVTPCLIRASFLGPLLGLCFLILISGGLPPFIEIYQLLVSKASQLPYAIKTGDGPWHRYLVDMLIVSPIVTLLAVSALFTQLGKNRVYLFLALFVGCTYAMMCNVKYAMNLRYSSIWELPVCVLAAAQLSDLAARFGRYRQLAFCLITAGICAYGLRQYLVFFADYPMYELVTEGLLRAVHILK